MNFKATVEAGIQGTLAVIAINNAVNASLTPPPTPAPAPTQTAKPTPTPLPPPTIEPGERYFILGQAQFTAEKYHGSIDSFTKSLEFNSSDPRAYIGRARSHMAIFGHANALDDIEQALSLDPKQYDAYRLRIEVRSTADEGTLVRATTRTDFVALIDDATTALALPHDHNEDSVLYAARGLLYAQIEDYVKALNDLDRAVRLDNRDAAIYTSRAAVHRTIGNSSQADLDEREACLINHPYSGTVGVDLLRTMSGFC